MKKKIYYLVFLLFPIISNAQIFGEPPTYDGEDFESSLKSIRVFRTGLSPNVDECGDNINGVVWFGSPITDHPGPPHAFGYYKYDFYLYLYGIDSNGNHVLVDTVLKDVDDYTPIINNTAYSYNLYSGTGLNIENLPYEYYYLRFKITKMVTNNDPGMYWFFPVSHWETEHTNLEPKCGYGSCPESFNGFENPNPCDWNDDGGDDNDLEPDLVTTSNNVLVISDCSDCNITLSNLGSDKHKITPSTTLQIVSAMIENSSSAVAQSSKVKYYVEATSAAGVVEYELPYTTDIPSIPGNSSYVFSHTIFGVDFPPLAFGSNYKILFKLDAINEVSESNESNNKISIPLKWASSTSGRIYLNTYNGSSILIPFDYDINNQTTNIKMYSVAALGNTSPVVNVNFNGIETNINITHLPTGQYAVHINDRFVRQILVKNKGGGLIDPIGRE